MKRKKFLLLSAAGAASIVLPSVNSCNTAVEYPDSLAHPRSISMIWDSGQIESIGNAYLRKVPGQANKQALARSLLTDAPSDSTAIPGFMEQQVGRDFETGDTVMVDGWILSETEARQCALYSLKQAN